MAVATPPAKAFEIFGFKLFETEEERQDAEIVDPLFYTLNLAVENADEDLTEALENASQMKADEERPVSGSLGLLAKARSERELLVAALYENARYEGIVTILIDGRDLDSLPPDAEFPGSGPVPVSISIEPGPLFTLGDIALKGDAADLMATDYGLISGGDAGSTKILQAEARIVEALKEEGRPLAKVTGREIVADHNTSTLDVALTVAAGPVAGYGATTVEGTEKVDREFTEYMTGLEPGRTYSPEEVEDARERLLALQVFSSVTVREAEALDVEGNIPMNVEVSERKHRYFGAGATFSNTEGFGVEGYWGHRNLFGRAEKLRIEGSIGRIGATEEVTDFGKLNYNAAIMFEKPGVLGPASKFFTNTRVAYDHPDAYDRFTAKSSMGLSYELTSSQEVSAEFMVDYSKIDDAFGENEFLIVSTPLQYIFDNRDDRLNPTTGIRLLAFAEPAYDTLNDVFFVKLRGEASGYQAIDADGQFIVAGRIAAGSIFGASLDQVPADRRFYAGGGGSVRGYAYQGIGPKDADGDPTGGVSYAEGSLELRIAVNDTFGIVPFVDVGTVSEEQYPEFSNFRAGAGIGVRYLTPFGPLRVDVAIPLNRGPGDPSYGIYAGVGQAF